MYMLIQLQPGLVQSAIRSQSLHGSRTPTRCQTVLSYDKYKAGDYMGSHGMASLDNRLC